MISVSDALQTVLTRISRAGTVCLPLADALDRVLVKDACADLDSPPFDASAMDGYALRRADIAGSLRVVGAASAGQAHAGPVGSGECVRILTGAPVPIWADCVVKQEDVTREGDHIRVKRPDGPSFIRLRGENQLQGEVVVRAGTRLGPPELAALASAGIDQPEVACAPRCVHLVTGNELVPPGQKPVGAQIRDSNSTLVAALLRSEGAQLLAQTRMIDDLAQAKAAMDMMPDHDVLLISGGASVGDHDIARPLLTVLGYTLHFQEVNLRPGRPLAFASRGSRLAFALPGNPVSHWVVFQLFVAPLLRQLETGIPPTPVRLKGRLAPGGRLPPPDSRATYWPCVAAVVAGTYEVTLLTLASSGDSSGLVGANALMPMPGGKLEPGQAIEFILCL
jgi:molybdopterin molybdotransferase